MKRGSIELARHLCYEIAGPTDENDNCGAGYGSVDVAEILSAEVERLRAVIDAAPHLPQCPGMYSIHAPAWMKPGVCTCWKRLARLRGQGLEFRCSPATIAVTGERIGRYLGG